jgi:hypothetical protein
MVLITKPNKKKTIATIASSSIRNLESEKGRRFVERMDDDEHKTSSSSPVVISGILFSRSVRSGFASFTLAPISSSSSSAITTTGTTEMDQSQSPILVRLQFTDSTQELRSFCRKQYKIGDQIDVLCTNTGQWQQSSERSSTPSSSPSSSRNKNQQQNWSQQPRWVVGLSSTSDAQKSILVRTSRIWSMRDCQQYQLRYLPQNKKDKQQQRQQQQQSIRRKRKNNNNDDDDDNDIDNDAFVHTTTTRDTNTDNSSQKEQQTQQQQRQSSHLNGGDDDNLRRMSNNHHGGGGKEKLLQAQELVSFLMQLIGNKLSNSQEQPDVEKNANAISTVDLKEVPTSDYVSNTTTNTATATNSPTMMTTATIKQIQQQQNVRDWLNRGGGVLDVAGGCGHVSMALGMNGVLSTAVDARESVGKLPKKDRKIWKRSLLNKPQRRQKTHQVEEEIQPPLTYNSDHTISSNTHHHQTTTTKEISDYKFCQLVDPPPVVVPFQSQRAWFGSKPCGYDESYRHPDEENLPILVATAISDKDSDDHSKHNKESQDRNSSNYDGTNNDDLSDVQGDALLRRQTSALVALHPDEATGEIVQQAVKHRIPFVVVPCCVFARLFPERQTNNGQSVSSYENLLEYLQELDTSIQRTHFGFAGKNIALWSTFPDG